VIALGEGRFLEPKLPAIVVPVLNAVFRGGPGNDAADNTACSGVVPTRTTCSAWTP
jgi:hypothetical protein